MMIMMMVVFAMIVAFRTLTFMTVVRSCCVYGWRYRPPPSILSSRRKQQQRRLLQQNLSLLTFHNRLSSMKSQSEWRRLVNIRGGNEDVIETENVITSSSVVLEKERSDSISQEEHPPSLGLPFVLPPKIPRVEFPERTRPSTGSTYQKVLLLMDSFCDVHGLFLAERARDVYGVATLQVYSDYMRGYFLQLEPRPDNLEELLSMCMPSSLEEVTEWSSRLDEIFGTMGDGTAHKNGYELVGLVCDSDSGLAHAEQLADWLNVTSRNPGGVREERRNKYLMVESIRSAGIATVQQRLCTSREEAVEFATSLLRGPTSASSSTVQSKDGDSPDDVEDYSSPPPSSLSSSSSAGSFRQSRVVVKPVRGCGSDDVHLCDDLDSVVNAFDRIHGSGIFGSPGQRHEAVLVQEFAPGQEFAIDTVSRDGKLKIVAIWKYDKRPANGAPFVYYATQLYDDSNDYSGQDPICPVLYDYLNNCLDALGVRWGITHSEVIVTPDGPRLVEVNCRQHNMDFLPLTMGGIGYNMYDVLLAAYFGPTGNDDATTTEDMLVHSDKDRLEWDLIPDIPTTRMNAAMVHLVNSKSGILKSVNDEALYEIQAMASVVDLEVYNRFLEVGTQIFPTIDIKSDAGWIQLVHPDSEIFEADYQRIIELMPTLFEVEEGTAPGSTD